MAFLRKYGVETTVVFPLIERDAVDFEESASFGSGDARIMKDEGSPSNTSNTPANEGDGHYSITLTATEMQAARIMVLIRDQTDPKVWEDQAIVIETYGHASAQHALDLDDAELDVNVANWRGSQPNTLQSGRVDAYAGALAAGVITATAIASSAITSAKMGADAFDKLLTRAISNVESASFRTLYGAIAALVNRRRFDGNGDLEIFETDDTTQLAVLTRTTDADGEPTKELDPS